MTDRFRIGCRAATLAGTSLLAACGGGGGVQSTPTPIAAVPAPTPAPTPTPTPAPSPTPTPSPTPAASYDTTEYRQTLGAVDMNALAAYQHGATGAGITAAVIDSGIDTTSAEFTGRIASASQNVAGGSGIVDQDGHGTAVAFTLAGRRNGTATQGVAFDATLLVLRADTPGSCAGTAKGAADSACSFNDDTIAHGVDAAVTAGARVINMSLGGSAPSESLVAAIGRATQAGIVVVIAAGNDGAANPDAFAEIANQAAVARGQVIIAGSINPPAGYENATAQAGPADALSSFSNRAGDAAQHYLAAVGAAVRAPDNAGTAYIWSGTSFSAPQISAAVALLAQAFPNLTGAQIVQILLSSARDAGDPGTDAVYGRGILDLTRAFQPLGTATVAGTRVAVSGTTAGSLSAPMGDAHATLGAVILDGYSRAFAADLGAGLRRQGLQRTLTAGLQSTTRTLAGTVGGTSVSLTIAPRLNGDVALDRTTFAPQVAEQGRAIAGIVTQQLGARASFAIGYAEGGSVLAAGLAGERTPAFLVAGDPRQATGFDARPGGSAALRRAVAGWGVTVAGESGIVPDRDGGPLAAARGDRGSGYTRMALAIDRRVGPVTASVSGTRLTERDSVLGARLGDALGSPNAASWFADAAARIEPGAGWTLGGSVRQGWTSASARLGLAGEGLIRTGGWAADIGKAGVFARDDSAGLRVAQPLRVTGGGIGYRLPTAWDYATGSVAGWGEQQLNLSPTGRELDVEARYARTIGSGTASTNLFWRRDPGNVAALSPDYGAAVRWSWGF